MLFEREWISFSLTHAHDIIIYNVVYLFFFQESNEDEIFKLTEELEELKIANESLQRVTTISLVLMCYFAEHNIH